MTDRLRRACRALISVSDKSGLVEFARALADEGIELISTGGTRKALADAGLPVLEVSELTGFPEMMDGRVKTLHPKVHGGLLAVRDNEDHTAAMRAHGVRPIDLLVVNLYPFEATVANGANFDTCIENIDIGGPAMIRAAAKNHADVAVVVDASDYAVVLAELTQHGGAATAELRKKLAAKAYARTAAYDAAISNWFAVALGRALDAEAARAITEIFTEVIVAPGASDEAVAIVGAKKNLRLLVADRLPDPHAPGMTFKSVAGGLLVQSRDNAVVDNMTLD